MCLPTEPSLVTGVVVNQHWELVEGLLEMAVGHALGLPRFISWGSPWDTHGMSHEIFPGVHTGHHMGHLMRSLFNRIAILEGWWAPLGTSSCP